jgi:hypothetical protein
VIHERECDYCGRMAMWRDADACPVKCLGCGAGHFSFRAPPRHYPVVDGIQIIYGHATLRPEWACRLAFGA